MAKQRHESGNKIGITSLGLATFQIKIKRSKMKQTKIRKPVIRERITRHNGVVSVTAQLKDKTFNGTAKTLSECYAMRDRYFGI